RGGSWRKISSRWLERRRFSMARRRCCTNSSALPIVRQPARRRSHVFSSLTCNSREPMGEYSAIGTSPRITGSARTSPSSIAAPRSCGRNALSKLCRATVVVAVALALLSGRQASMAGDVDASPPPILQWFESSYRTVEDRLPDVFTAGYGFVWLPPPYRADMSDFSVGYDVYDRFDLGRPGRPTLYGTEDGLKTLARMVHRAGLG